jgi:predicted permease
MRTIWQDIRYGARMLIKSPGFTAIALITLAIGIGANTAIFSLIDALMFKSLPGAKNPERLVLVMDERDSLASLTYPTYEELCDNNCSLSGLFASAKIRGRRLVVDGSRGQAESVQAQAVSTNFFEVLGVRMAFGQSLMPGGDRRQDSQPVVVISYAFWQRRFGRDRAVVGSRIILDDVPFTVVGVAPQGFFGFEVGTNPDLWWPIRMVPSLDGRTDALTSRGYTWVRAMGRLKPAVTREQASAELNVIYRQILDEKVVRWNLSQDQRENRLKWKISLRPGGAGWTELRHELGRPLLILMGIVGLVLLVACANLAGLLLARGTARIHELATRLALGASRWTLGCQLMTESVLLSVMGGILGLLLAQWGVQLLAGYVPGYGQAVLLDLTPDLRILAFTLVVSAASGIFFGIVPAWFGSRMELAVALRGITGNVLESRQVWNKALVASQIALSCCLLIGTGLFVRTVQELHALDLGFDRERLMVFGLDTSKDYDQTRWVNLCHEVLERARQLPRVRSASFSSVRSLTGANGAAGPRKVAAADVNPATSEGLAVETVGVAPQYFETTGIRLLRGRDFGPQDELAPGGDPTKETTYPVILDQTGAQRLFGDANAVGKHLRPIGLPFGLAWSSLEVVGVVEDAIHSDVHDGPSITLYGPERFYFRGFIFFYVKTHGNPLALADGIRQMVCDLDPTVAVTGLRTMNDILKEQLLRERLTSQLAGFFSVSALLIACLGLYGILSYDVARRTKEIGVRMALGARAGNVLALVIRQGMKLALAGCVIGILLAMVLTRLISSQLYGVKPVDPLTFVGVGLILLVVALLACYLPARRAARINPMEALKYE